MEKIYKSRIAGWFIALCILMPLVLIATIYLALDSTPFLLIDILFIGLAVVMVFDILLHTDYTISSSTSTLRIRSGILYRQTLPISKITRISHRSTILSSPALSAKRICLTYGKTNHVYISPRNQADFISTLKSINPQIEIV